MELATMAAAHYCGITTDDVIERFGCAKRTAQRMLHALETQFLDTVTFFDEEGRKRWRLPQAAMRDLISLTPEELTSLTSPLRTYHRLARNWRRSKLANSRRRFAPGASLKGRSFGNGL